MNFEFLSTSIGTPIQLERGGPDKVVGELVDVRSDYIVLRNQQHGVLYCASEHVKTITHAILPVIESGQSEEASDSETLMIPVVEADNFLELLHRLRHAFIQVNTGGPNALKGVLMEVRPDSITLMNEMKEYVHYSIHHIRSIARIYNISSEDNQKEQNRDGNKKESSKDERKESRKDDKKDSSKDDRKESRREDRKDDSRKHGDRKDESRRHGSKKEDSK